MTPHPGRALVAALLLAGAAATAAAQPLFGPTQDPVAGSRAFGDKGCGKCHAVNGVGGKVGPDLGRSRSSARSRSARVNRRALVDAGAVVAAGMTLFPLRCGRPDTPAPVSAGRAARTSPSPVGRGEISVANHTHDGLPPHS